MIHTVLPVQYSSRTGGRVSDPHKRLMAAVLQAVIDDCRGGTAHCRAGKGTIDPRTVNRAIAYVTSGDRAWPFSFENLCDALGLDAGTLRQALDGMRALV
jgi:hypothetical protein